MLFLVLTLFALPPTPLAGAISGTDYQLRPSRWTPTGATLQVAEDATWGDFAYYINWGGPASSFSLDEPRNDHGTFEFGMKKTSRVCHEPQLGTFGKSGFPMEVEAQVDYTEDPGDALLWVSDLDRLAVDIRGDKSKIYSAWWGCTSEHDFNQSLGPEGPYLQNEIGHWIGVNEPIGTIGDAQLRVIPAEQGR
jgi:hypothetical protein